MVFTVEPALATELKKTGRRFPRQGPVRVPHVQRCCDCGWFAGADTYEFQKVAGTGENPADKWQRVVDGKATPTSTRPRWRTCCRSSRRCARSRSPRPTKAAGNAPAALVVSASYDTDKFERVRFIKTDKQVRRRSRRRSWRAKLDASAYDETMKALDAVLAPPPPPPPPPAK